MIADGNYSRILLIRRKALGDALVTIPAVREVARKWADAHIDLVIDRPFAPLIQALVPEVEVVVWPTGPDESWIRRLLGARYDLVIDWLGSPRTAGWTLLTGARTRVGYDLPRRRWAYNIRVPRNSLARESLTEFAGEAFMDPLRALGLQPSPWRSGSAVTEGFVPEPDRLGEAYRKWAALGLTDSRPLVILVMSATWSAKAWPDDAIVKLFALLKAEGIRPLLVTGPGDETLEDRLRNMLPPDGIAPPTNLLELADLLGHARLFVGTDCGVRHLAACLNIPTVTLFGPTDPGGWNPAVPTHVALRTGEDCSPCDLARCPVPGHPCMAELTPEMVMIPVRKLLDRSLEPDSRTEGIRE